MTTSRAKTRPRTGFALALAADGIERLATLAGAIGQAGFYPAAVLFLRSLIDAEVSIAMRYSADERPQYLSVLGDAARRRGAREIVYLDGPFILDPVYQMFQHDQADGAYAMAEYVPDDFYESEYYERFFRGTQLLDTIDILWRIDTHSAITFCLGREVGSPPFEALELALVRHVLPLLFAAMRRHHELIAPPTRDENDRLVHSKVHSTMAHFGSSLLTKRERQVVFHMLSGYSAEQTAQRLNTAEGTIRIHRKNIHRKLETSSQAELFSLFIQCIPFADPDDPCDPLARYQAKPARTAR